MNEPAKVDILKNTSVGKLIARMSLPNMVSMLSLAIVNLVGGAMISSTSGGLEAISVAYPFEALLTAFAIGLGIGTGSAVSRRLGKGETRGADDVAATGVCIALMTGASIAAAGLGASGAFVGLFPLSAADAAAAKTYLYIVSAAIPITVTHTLFNRISVSTGLTFRPMLAVVSGAALTLIVDYLLVFGKLGIKQMSMTGLAIGNAAGQTLTLIIAIIVVAKAPVNVFLHRGFRLRSENVKDILGVALPSIVQNAVGALFLTVLNAILIEQSYVKIYGAFYKVQSLAYMPAFGLNQGSMPIMGYACGAGNKKRFVKTLKLTLIAALILTICVFAVTEIVPDRILSLFNLDGDFVSEGATAFRILAAAFVPSAFSLILAAMFTSTGHGASAMTLNVLRGAVLGLPAAYFLKKYVSINAAWMGIAAAEIIVPALFIPVAIVTFKKIFPSKKKDRVHTKRGRTTV